MSIVTKETAADCEYTNQDCFYCGKPMKFPFIHWFGAQGHIYLHPDCVTMLFTRMELDGHSINGIKFNFSPCKLEKK